MPKLRNMLSAMIVTTSSSSRLEISTTPFWRDGKLGRDGCMLDSRSPHHGDVALEGDVGELTQSRCGVLRIDKIQRDLHRHDVIPESARRHLGRVHISIDVGAA